MHAALTPTPVFARHPDLALEVNADEVRRDDGAEWLTAGHHPHEVGVESVTRAETHGIAYSPATFVHDPRSKSQGALLEALTFGVRLQSSASVACAGLCGT